MTEKTPREELIERLVVNKDRLSDANRLMFIEDKCGEYEAKIKELEEQVAERDKRIQELNEADQYGELSD